MTTRSAAYSKAKRHNAGTYRSGLEEKNSDFLKSFSIEPHYEEQYLEYVVPQSTHKYTPDFVLPNGIIIETKGVWDAEDSVSSRRSLINVRLTSTKDKPDI